MEKITIKEILRSRRKTIALIITPDAQLVIKAPLRAPVGYIQNIVNEKSDWIRTKLQEVAKRPKPRVKQFVEGEEFLYLGKAYKLHISEKTARDVEIVGDNLCLAAHTLPKAQELLKHWYKEEAGKVLAARCDVYRAISAYEPRSIRISEARRRWGSCGAKGTLNFSWRLIMAPLEIIDYLVVHELVHIGYLNHSQTYWQKVAELMPDYRQREKWLWENSWLLSL